MYTLDLSPFVRSTVGFDRLARIGEDALRFDEAVMSYRPTVGFDRPARRFDEATMSFLAGINARTLPKPIDLDELSRSVDELIRPDRVATPA